MAAPSESKSYFSDPFGAFSWGAKEQKNKQDEDSSKKKSGIESNAQTTSDSGLGAQRGGDRVIGSNNRLSLRNYPEGCPELNVQWFHATDVPKRHPKYISLATAEGNKPSPEPKKWLAFSVNDSKAIEKAYQQICDDQDSRDKSGESGESTDRARRLTGESRAGHRANASIDAFQESSSVKVPVNEDYLFDVDVQSRELGPAYWLGPIYEVRRGTWFEGSTMKPVEENLATQLEEGYLKTKAWQNVAPAGQPRSLSSSREPKAENASTGKTAEKPLETPPKPEDPPRPSSVDPTEQRSRKTKEDAPAPITTVLPTHRLFGPYMGRVATYSDPSTVYVVADDFLTRMSISMFQRFGATQGTKYIRGYNDPLKKKAVKGDKRPTTPTKSDEAANSAEQGRASPGKSSDVETDDEPAEKRQRIEPRRLNSLEMIERQVSNLVASNLPGNREKEDEEMRKREQQEIEHDYKESSGDSQDRDIEHLILVTHGIGQRLGARFETFNFIHDVNDLRKTLKGVYSGSPDLQALNSEINSETKNCRVQVLPICWRHLLDFPQQGVKSNRKENDITDASAEEDEEYPNLEAITVEGAAVLRSIVSDIALDILLYQTPAYRDHIARAVVRECNRIHQLFKKRNPTFDGKVSLAGHSLGSAIIFDILCEQDKAIAAFDKPQSTSPKETRLDFDTQDFYCLGSPIGLFQMLKGKRISGRTNPNKVTLDGFPDSLDDPSWDPSSGRGTGTLPTDIQQERMTSSPKCNQLYNIFHPSDPVGYRVEPLISSAMASMKPQPLPYTKKNFFSAPMGQGFTGIPAKVGQSFSGMWSNFSSGLANSFINRSLGISAEDAAKLTAMPPPATAAAQAKVPNSLGAGTNIVGGGVISTDDQVLGMEGANTQGAVISAKHNPAVLIDGNVDTLYTGFQRQRRPLEESDANRRDFGDSPAWSDFDDKGRRLRREEAKVRALNKHGRVDYSIQEGAFDISFLASIASHLSYWTDEDVSHFIISQLLSRQRGLKRTRSTGRLE